MTKKVTVLGSTGSIGTQSLDVIRAQEYSVFGLAAHSNVELLLRQVQEFHPHCIAVVDDAAADRAARELHGMPGAPVLLRGKEGLEELAAMDGSDIVLNAVVGIAGLAATLSAIKSGRDVALANKESLVTGGSLVTDAVRENNVKLLPVDSEHSAIFQCLQDEYSAKSLQKILLTASGGPFFGRTRQELQNVTKDDALRHPNWSMGSKITIDSATLMNKGLELIEAVWLFGLPAEQVQVVVQRQSIIHSMVQFSDNSILAQLGVPDMRIPIQYALTYPARIPSPVRQLRLEEWGKLTFCAPDDEAFPTIGMARQALRQGGLYPAALNAANEVAVEAFLDGRIRFPDIPRLAGETLEMALPAANAVEDVFAVDAQIRAKTREKIATMK